MKSIFIAILMMLAGGCNATEQHVTQSEPLTGIVPAEQLLTQYPQFQAVYEQYQPSQDEVTAAKSLAGKSLIVLFGTWCHDSEREVPRLLKLLDLSRVELEDVALHGIDYKKKDPNDLYLQYNLKYTPTIILLEGEKELGRIIEKPTISLGEDLAHFVTR